MTPICRLEIRNSLKEAARRLCPNKAKNGWLHALESPVHNRQVTRRGEISGRARYYGGSARGTVRPPSAAAAAGPAELPGACVPEVRLSWERRAPPGARGPLHPCEGEGSPRVPGPCCLRTPSSTERGLNDPRKMELLPKRPAPSPRLQGHQTQGRLPEDRPAPGHVHGTPEILFLGLL